MAPNAGESPGSSVTGLPRAMSLLRVYFSGVDSADYFHFRERQPEVVIESRDLHKLARGAAGG